MHDAHPRPIRRADAERNISAILDAASRVFAERADASLGDIARAAGVSRQTIHAHFRTREELVGAVLDRAVAEVAAALDNAVIDGASASDALIALLDASWEMFERFPFLLDESLPQPSLTEDRERHVPIVERLERIFERGQRSGEFAAESNVAWLVTSTIALGHAGGAEVSAGRLSTDEARRAVRRSVLAVLGAN